MPDCASSKGRQAPGARPLVLFAVERLNTVIKNMPEFTLHDDIHIFNMLSIIGKLISQENMSVNLSNAI